MVIFLFLHNLWATIIPSVVVPLSLVATFGVMFVAGYSLDNLSLMGLTIAVGFVVDDAIVMIENIVRYLEMGDSPFEAALKGSSQIGFTIISITFSLVAVFIPLLFMAGIVGRLFREFAMTVTTAVLVSAFVSLTLTPMMCSLFLTRESAHGKNFVSRWSEIFLRPHDQRLRPRIEMGLPAPVVNADCDALAHRRHRRHVLRSAEGLLSRTGHRVHFRASRGAAGRLVCRDHQNRESVRRHHCQRPSCVRRCRICRRDWRQCERKHCAPLHSAQAAKRASRDRPRRSSNACARKSAQVEGAKFFMQAGQDISVGGRLSKTEYQYTLTDTDTEELNHWAPILEQALQKVPALQDVASDQQIASPHIAITINRNEAYKLGLSLSTIDQSLYDAFGQRQVATIYTSSQQAKVILEVEPQFQNDPAALSRIYLTTPRVRISRSPRSRNSAIRSSPDRQPPGSVPGSDFILQCRTRLFARPSRRQHPDHPRQFAHRR